MSFDPRDPPDPYEDSSRGHSGRERSPQDTAGSHDPYDYSDPLDPRGRSSESQRQAARGMVVAPGIILIVIGIFNLFSGVSGLFMGFAVNAVSAEDLEVQMRKQNPKQVEDLKKAGFTVRDVQVWESWGFMITGVVSFVLALIIIAGGACMLGLKAWPLAVLAALLALISPGGCCIFGMGAGIWALVVLFNSDVRAGYR